MALFGIERWRFGLAAVAGPAAQRQTVRRTVLADSGERTIVSLLGWIDGGAIWVLETKTGRTRSVDLGGAKYISLHCGRSNHFSAVHHYDSDQLVINVHHFDRPASVLIRFVVSQCSLEI